MVCVDQNSQPVADEFCHYYMIGRAKFNIFPPTFVLTLIVQHNVFIELEFFDEDLLNLSFLGKYND